MSKIRLEHRERKPGYTEYYLVASFGVDGRVGNVRRYLGTNRPSSPALSRLTEENLAWFEEQLIGRKANLAVEKFKTDLLTTDQLLELERLKFAWVAVRRYLNPGELEVQQREFETDYIHGSTSIEGNSLTKPEVYDLLAAGKLPAGKPAREIYEVTNYKKVRRYREKYAGDLTLKFILRIHELLLDNIDYENAGVIRRIDVSIAKRFQGTPPPMIETELIELLAWYRARCFRLARWKEAGKPPVTHPFVLAGLFHHRFETIHPFIDGNGRTGRELFNFILQKQGYPPMVFAAEEREPYLEALIKGDRGDEGGMVGDLYQLYHRHLPAFLKDPRLRQGLFTNS